MPLRPAADGALHRRFDVARTAVPASVVPAASDRRPLGAHFLSLRPTADEDRLRRLAALARAHRRQQLHPRLARRARRGGAARGPRGGRVRADLAARGGARSPRRSTGSRSSCASMTLPGAHGWRTAWSRLGWPPAERWLGPFDVLHFTDWMYPPQRAGLRATTIHDLVPLHFPEWVTGRTRSMHGRKYAERRAHLRRDVRQLGLHRRRHRRDARLPARADRRRASRDRRRVRHRRRGGRPRRARTCSRSRRSSRARTSARSSTPSRCSPTTELVARGRRRRGLGRAAAARPARRRPARPRLRRGARAALPRRGGRRLPVAVRGLRDADHRGDGLRRAGRRVGAPVAGRGLRRRGRARRPRERRGVRGRDPRRARRAATSCARRASRTRRGFSWARTGELFLEGYARFS